MQTLWWRGSFSYRERISLDEEENNRYLSDFVGRELAARGLPSPPAPGSPRSGLRTRLERLRP